MSKVSARVHAPFSETLLQVGRSPRMPQKLAGTRTLPPVSLPMAKSTDSSATATCIHLCVPEYISLSGRTTGSHADAILSDAMWPAVYHSLLRRTHACLKSLDFPVRLQDSLSSVYLMTSSDEVFLCAIVSQSMC